jgi:hypothetical protein
MCLLHPVLSPYLRACRHNASLRSHQFAALFCGTLRGSEIAPSSPQAIHVEPPRVRIVVASPEGAVEDVLPFPTEPSRTRDLFVRIVGSCGDEEDALSTKTGGEAVDANVVVFSDSPGFEKFAGASDVYVPTADTTVGRYPYVRRNFMQDISVSAEMLLREEPNSVP